MGGNCDDREGKRGRDGGCGPEIDATLRARVKDVSVRGSMLARVHRLLRSDCRLEGGATGFP